NERTNMKELMQSGVHGIGIGLLVMLACLAIAAVAGACMAVGPNVRDALQKVTKTLAAAATSATSTALDTGIATSKGMQSDEVEFLLPAPATGTNLADG